MASVLTRYLVLLLFVTASAAVAQNPIESLISTETQEARASAPDPFDLKANWWDYFSVDAQLLPERIANAEDRLQAIAAELSEQERATLDSLINRIVVNLRALPSARALVEVEPFIADTLKASYSVDELLRVRRDLSQARTALESERSLVDQVTASLRESRDALEEQLGRYLGSSGREIPRLQLALELMGRRAAQALVAERLRLYRASLKRQEARVVHLSEELEEAQERLSLSVNQQRIDVDDIRMAQNSWEAARREAFEAEADAVLSGPDKPSGQANALLLSQRATLANIMAAREQVNVLSLQIRYRLLGTEAPASRAATLELGMPDSWPSALQLLTEQLEPWASASRQELQSAREQLSGLSEEPDSLQLRVVLEQRLETAETSLVEVQRLEQSLLEASLLLSIQEEQVAQRKSPAERWLGRIIDQLWALAAAVLGVLQVGWTFGGTYVRIQELIEGIFIMLIALWISRLISKALSRAAMPRWGISNAALYTMNRMLRYGVLLFAFILAMQNLGVGMQSLVIVLGALSVGIGFGLQSIVNNFLSGLIILFERPLRVGDYLELESGLRGRVTSINVRSTRLRTNDGIDVIVPNAQVIEGRVTNWTMSDAFRRLHVPFSVAYSSDTDLVQDVVLQAAHTVDYTLRGVRLYPEPELWLVSMGDNGLHYELVVWVNAHATKRHAATMAAYTQAIHRALRSASIEIPFPQRDVHVKSLPDSQPTP